MSSTPEQAIIIEKTTAGVWDETINWGCPSRQLGADLIVASIWALSGPDAELSLNDADISDDQKKTTIWLSGGTEGAVYSVTNTVTTQDDRVFTGTFLVSIVPFVYFIQPRVI